MVAITTLIPTPLTALSVYFVAPLFPGFLLSAALGPKNGPPIGWTWVMMASIAPVLSGSIIYGLIVYLLLRLIKNN